MDAEKNVIGALLMDSECVNDIRFLKPEMFSNKFLGRIFLEYLRASDMMESLIIPELVNRMHDFELSKEQTFENIKFLLEYTITSATVKQYAKVVYDDYRARKMNKVLNKIRPEASDIDNQLANAILQLEGILDNKENSIKSMKDIVNENKDKYFVEKPPRPNTGIECIDNRILWFEEGDMTIVGARPSAGKSALTLQIAENVSNQGFKCIIYNLEMVEAQVFERAIAKASGIKLTRLKQAISFLGDEKEKYEKALEYASNLKIDTKSGSFTASEIRSHCKNMGYDLIIIDYLQLIRSESGNFSENERVGNISMALKALAMDLRTHVLAVSQFNRASEYTPTKEPDMQDLRGSGQLEQDASNIILLWNLDEEKIKKGCKVSKARQGVIGKDVLEFNGANMTFTSSNESIESIRDSGNGFKKTKKEWDSI